MPCERDPDKEVAVNFTTSVKIMVELWMRDTSYRKTIASNTLKAVGPSR